MLHEEYFRLPWLLLVIPSLKHAMKRLSYSQLIQGYSNLSGDRKYNLIITSDHGMAGYKRKYELPKALRDKAKRFYGGKDDVVFS